MIKDREYVIKFHPKAQKEFNSLDGRLKIEVAKKIYKLKKKPELGKTLGRKYGINLTGCRSIRFNKGDQRIVYIIKKNIIQVQIISIGNRERESVYQKASDRLI